MTNPGNAIGTNAAFGGRTSVNAFNDGLAGYTRGILSGWACVPNSGLTVALGGSGTVRDVAIAEDNAGNKNTINNISNSPVSVTMSAAPASNSRIDLIVAYVDNPSNGTATATDNPGACGIIPVAGTAAASPVAPNESAIRSAITADGANGAAAYYVVLAKITIASGTTDITSNMIEAGAFANHNLDYSLDEVDTGMKWVNGKHIYKKTINFGALPNNDTKRVEHGINNLDRIIHVEQSITNAPSGSYHGFLFISSGQASVNDFNFWGTDTQVCIRTSGDRRESNAYITLYYTKTTNN